MKCTTTIMQCTHSLYISTRLRQISTATVFMRRCCSFVGLLSALDFSKMGKRHLVVDWSKVPGASLIRKKLYLRPDPHGVYLCPDGQCLHSGFKSKRGCRKHVDTQHKWKYYFEQRPNVGVEEMTIARTNIVSRPNTLQMPSFSTEEGLGSEFKSWLSTPCGGGKNERESVQSCKRAMKYLMYCAGSNETLAGLNEKFVDCCLGSALMLVDFLRDLQTNWNVGHAGAINYLKSISDIMDFRKAHGVSDESLRSFAVTEVYLRRGKRCLARKSVAEWTRNFDLETLISQNSWATVKEMESVIPFHLPRFKEVIEKCKGPLARDVEMCDLTFASRFVTTFLFLSVKCSRPMTFQRLTVEMMKRARKENGYVDQREFKTADKYLYDTLIFTEDAQDLIGMYIDHCRPLLHPLCDNVLVNNNGKMLDNLGHAMTILVYEAIGKHINPTRYRQIIETASSDQLSLEEQAIVSKDQKHDSKVAEVYYKKKLSRDIALKGKQCMEKIFGESRIHSSSTLSKVMEDLRNSEESFGVNIISGTNIHPAPIPVSVSPIKLDSPTYVREDIDVTETKNNCLDEEHIAVKTEVTEKVYQGKKMFTTSEDTQLLKGLKKFGNGKWAVILKDGAAVFHSSRTRDALRMRAQSAVFKRTYKY